MAASALEESVIAPLAPPSPAEEQGAWSSTAIIDGGSLTGQPERAEEPVIEKAKPVTQTRAAMGSGNVVSLPTRTNFEAGKAAPPPPAAAENKKAVAPAPEPARPESPGEAETPVLEAEEDTPPADAGNATAEKVPQNGKADASVEDTDYIASIGWQDT